MRAAVMRPGLLLLSMLTAVEVLEGGAYRAITLTQGERRAFRVPELERVTAGTGKCVEEGLEREEAETLYVLAQCGGVRTTVAWKRDGVRVQLMVCAEEGTPAAGLLLLRKTVQGEVRALRGVTACVRNGRVELWGWARNEEELQRMRTLERKYPDRVRSFVELIEG